MRRLAFAVTLLAVVGWGVAEGCGPWYVLRAALNPVLWQPLPKAVPELLGEPRKAAREPVFAGMHAGGTPELAAARRAYRELASWRVDHFQAWEQQEAA